MDFTPKDGFPYYFGLAGDLDSRQLFSSELTFSFLDGITETQARHRYAADKWSIKQVLGHIADHERIKMFRAFLMSRKEAVELWGYDQNALVANSRFEELSFQQLKMDFRKLRQASISFIETLSEDQLIITGKARQYEISLEEFLKSIIGHEKHHIKLIKEKYL